MRGDERRLEDVVLVRDVADGLEEPLRILDEGDERADGEHVVPGVFCITRQPPYQMMSAMPMAPMKSTSGKKTA